MTSLATGLLLLATCPQSHSLVVAPSNQYTGNRNAFIVKRPPLCHEHYICNKHRNKMAMSLQTEDDQTHKQPQPQPQSLPKPIPLENDETNWDVTAAAAAAIAAKRRETSHLNSNTMPKNDGRGMTPTSAKSWTRPPPSATTTTTDHHHHHHQLSDEEKEEPYRPTDVWTDQEKLHWRLAADFDLEKELAMGMNEDHTGNDSSSYMLPEEEGPSYAVHNKDEHIRILDKSLKKLTGKGVYQRMREAEAEAAKEEHNNEKETNDADYKEEIECNPMEIHTNLRFALYSHGGAPYGESLDADASQEPEQDLTKPRLSVDGPVNNYGNYAALSAYGTSWDAFVQFPAVRMALPGVPQDALKDLVYLGYSNDNNHNHPNPNHDDDENHHDAFKEPLVVEGCFGARCRLSDRRGFEIKGAVVWDCYEDGVYYGRATLFDRELIELAMF